MMRPLSYISRDAETLQDGATSAPFPPVDVLVVPRGWQGEGVNPVVPEIGIEVYSDFAANAITAAELLAGILQPATFADDNVDTVDFANNELDIAAHGLYTGEGPFQLTTSGTLPTGLALLTDYWGIRVNAGTIQVAASKADALAETPVPVAFSDAGSGTHTIEDTASTERVRWHSLGLIGPAADGAITLDANGLAYVGAARNHARAICYAWRATFGSAVATYVKLTPIQEL